MLTFDTRGNLTPDKPIPSDVGEMKAFFVDAIPSETRQQNFDKYVQYTEDLKALVEVNELKQWINGSFVTSIPNPEDIDLVTFIDAKTIEQLGNALDAFRPDGSWSAYGVDAYIIEVHPEDTSLYEAFTRSDIAYWYEQFNRTKRNRRGEIHPKGFLEIYY